MVTRRTALKSIVAGALATSALPRSARSQASRPNIVFIVCDDMNTCVSPYSPEQKVYTPNLERLKATGAMFENAYAAVPACSPSRTAFMLGVDPTTSGTFINNQSWKDAAVPAGTETMVGHMKSQGWATLGTGKLFHRSARDVRETDWSEYFLPDRYSELLADLEIDRAKSADETFDFGPDEESALPDAQCAGWVVDKINAGMLDDGGVFLGLGLNRPHVPTVVPQEWFDRYPETVELPPGYWPGSTTLDGNLPDQEDLGRKGHRRIGSDRTANALIEHDELNDFLRSYYAATSFADHQIGRVIDALEAKGLMDNTYLIVTADHGFMLGEKRQFGKFEIREIALKVPLFVVGPGIAPRSVPDPVSLIDLYPTICGLAGVPIPSHCEGQDLSGTVHDGAAAPRGFAVSYYGGRLRTEGSAEERLQLHTSLRTPQWRMINLGPATNRWRRIWEMGDEEIELYDHDPDSPGYDPYEWYNVAAEHADVVEELRKLTPPPLIFEIVGSTLDEGE